MTGRLSLIFLHGVPDCDAPESGWRKKGKETDLNLSMVQHVRKEVGWDICGDTNTVVHAREYIGYGWEQTSP